MSDSFTKVTRTGYGSRLKSSFSGVLIGIILIIAAIYLLWYNEGRSIDRKQTLEQAGKEVISLTAWDIGSEHEGKLIHVSWLAQGDMILEDEKFWVTSEGIKLKRKVEMYQWQETSQTESKDNIWWSETTTTTYSYNTTWSEQAINSASFEQSQWHQNPTTWQVRSDDMVQKNVSIENLRLSQDFVSQINAYEDISLDNTESLKVSSWTWVFVSQTQIYYGNNPESPEVGDLRVSFLEVPEMEVSVMWEYNNDTLALYTLPKGSIALLDYGFHTAETMLDMQQKSNATLTWILRGVWILLLFIACNMILGPIVTLAKVLPFLSSIIGFWTGFISLIFALTVWPLVIALAWLYVRPILSISILVLVVLGVAGMIYTKKSKKEEVSTMHSDI